MQLVVSLRGVAVMSARTHARRKGTEIFSVFGQIEAAAADILIRKYGLYRIEFSSIPETARYNDVGVPARFAFVCPQERVGEFNQLCEGLRS